MTRELAQLYGAAEAAAPVLIPAPTSLRPRPERVTLISASGWRRYAIESEEASAHEAGIPTSVVTSDAGVRELVPRATPVEPGAFLAAVRPASSRAIRSGVADQTASGIRRVGRALASLRESTRAAPTAASTAPTAPTAPTAAAAGVATDDTNGGVYVLTHVSGSAWAAALLDARPGATVVVELDRVALGQPPVDGP